MDNITYLWLINNKVESYKLINSILTLSHNDLFISYDNLIKYHNNNNTTSPSINEIDTDKKLYGLSKTQFNIIHNNIDQLQNLKIKSKTGDQINISNTGDNKFDLSINLIIHNNNNLKIINNQKNIRDINKLFYLVWKNVIIRNQILFHMGSYNKHSNLKQSFNLLQLNEYKYKSYIHILKLGDIDEDEILKPNSIPNGIERIKFKSEIRSFIENSIPNSVTSISFRNGFDKVLKSGMIPNSVTSIQMDRFNQSLSGWIPKNIKHLDLGRSFQNPILPGQLPDSLTKLVLPFDYGGTIIFGSIPPAVKDLDFKFNSNNGKELISSNSIPKSTTNLEFDHYFKQNIKVGLIPHNVSSLKFNSKFGFFESKSLPLSLTSLDLKFSPFTSDNNNLLPPNLTYINMGYFNFEMIPHLFPMSIIEIRATCFNNIIPSRSFTSYSNLTTLYLDKYNQTEIPLNTFPKSLTSLNVSSYSGPLNAISELKSLKSLVLGGIERVISANQLPSSITCLTLKTKFPIGPNLLPPNLKKLILSNSEFNHDISINGYLPSTINSISIHPDSIDLIKCLNAEFFYKYINFIK